MDFKGYVIFRGGNLVDSMEGNCRLSEVETDFDRVCREVDAGREVTLYVDRELQPELHCGAEFEDERLTVWRDSGGRYHICATCEGEESEVATVGSIDEFKSIFDQIQDDPWDLLHL